MKSAGFTLLEILVALLVLGFLIVGLTGAARYGLTAAGRQAALSDQRGELDAVDRTVRRIVADADPQSPLVGAAGMLALVSALPAGARSTAQDAEIGLGVDARRRLVLRWTAHSSARPLGPAPAAQEVELLRDVQGIALSYWPAVGPGGWRASWNDPTLPALIRLRVIFPDGDARRWPEIVVAPMRQRLTAVP